MSCIQQIEGVTWGRVRRGSDYLQCLGVGSDLAGLLLLRPPRCGLPVGTLKPPVGGPPLTPPALPGLLPWSPLSGELVFRAPVPGCPSMATAVAPGAASVAPVSVSRPGAGWLPPLSGSWPRSPATSVPGARPPAISCSWSRPSAQPLLPLSLLSPPQPILISLLLLLSHSFP